MLLFVHADSTLPDGAGDAIRRAMQSADWGAFRIRFDPPLPLLERLVLWRSKLWHAPYGDQAMFVSRTAFDAVGGSAADPADGRLRAGPPPAPAVPVQLLDLAVVTSARRYQQEGVCERRCVCGCCSCSTGSAFPRPAAAALPAARTTNYGVKL